MTLQPPLGEKTTGTGGSVFDAAGSIGKQFTSAYSISPPCLGSQEGGVLMTNIAEGAIGGAAQKIGGPLDQSGAIGKQFTTGGSIGGMVQGTLGGGMKNSMQDKQ